MTDRREDHGMDDTETSELREHFDATDLSTDIDAATWETDVDDDPMIVTSLRLPKSLLDWVRARAEAERTKPTALIRRWVEDQRASEPGPDAAALAGLAARVDRLESVALRVIGSARAGEEDAAEDSMSDLLAALQRSVDAARRSAPRDEEPPSASRRGA